VYNLPPHINKSTSGVPLLNPDQSVKAWKNAEKIGMPFLGIVHNEGWSVYYDMEPMHDVKLCKDAYTKLLNLMKDCCLQSCYKSGDFPPGTLVIQFGAGDKSGGIHDIYLKDCYMLAEQFHEIVMDKSNWEIISIEDIL